jgi:hypothetical protein
MELHAGTELDSMECSEVAGAKLVCGMNLGSGRGRRMEPGRDGRHESGRRAGAVSTSGAGGVRPASGGQRGRAESVPRWQPARARAAPARGACGVRPSWAARGAGARSAEWACDVGGLHKLVDGNGFVNEWMWSVRMRVMGQTH